MKKVVKKLVPERIKQKVRDSRKLKEELVNMQALPDTICDTTNLKHITADELNSIFTNDETASAWAGVQSTLDKLKLPRMTGGINPGDQRAIFSLVQHYKPKSVLEIGTLIACSTTNIAVAMKQANHSDAKLISVDINDVNCKKLKLYEKYGCEKSPEELIQQLNYHDQVHFQNQNSIDYMKQTNDTFDFIFLDGSHDASIVYQEIPCALQRLNPDGIILLHDYFPDNKPMWSNKSVIPGPFWGSERLRKLSNNFRVLPLGALPWPTKLNSNMTSLAIMSAKK